MKKVVGALALASVGLIPEIDAQTTWGVEVSGPSYGEVNAPPCPVGPQPYAIHLPPVPFPGCPANLPFQIGCRMGGSAVDNDGNVFSGGPTVPALLNSDGFTIEMIDTAGNYIMSMPVIPGSILPGIITGMAYDSSGDVIWITDGVMAVGLGLNPCGAPPVVNPPFPIPLAGGTTASGLGWDPCSSTLWVSECGGSVTNFTTTGGFLSTFTATGVGLPLTGLDVNATNGNVQVTDGVQIGEFLPSGALAPTGPFYLTANPYPVAVWGSPIEGIGFSLRPQKYGRPCPSNGPQIGFGGGYPWAGNFGFEINQTNATPGRTAYLLLSLSYACPAIPFGGCPAGTGLWINFPLIVPPIIGGTVPATTDVSIPIPIPPAAGCAFPVGIGIFAQFINVGGGFELTDGLTFTIGQT